MAKFYLVCADALCIPHQGLRVKACYKQNPENLQEKPQQLVVFNRWPSVELEADVVDVPLDGVYEYPDKSRIDNMQTFCPKTKDGTYMMGYSPEEIVARRLKHLERVTE